MSFRQSKFKDIVDIKSGYTWTKGQEFMSPIEGSVRVLTVSNIQTKLDLSAKLYLTNVSDRDKINKAVSKDWSISVSSNGNRKRIGNAVFIENDLEYLFASFLTAFKPKDESGLLPKYFFYWFTTHNVQERITSISEGTTGLGNLDIRYLRNMIIKYPSNMREQNAIINIIQKVDDLISKTEESISALDNVRKSLLENLLSGKLNYNGVWRKEHEFVSVGAHNKYPKGWHQMPLGEISLCSINPRYEIDEAQVSTLIPMEAVKEGYGGIKYMTKQTIDYSGYVRFRNGDTLFAKITPCAENGKIAYVDCLKDQEEVGFASTEFFVFHPNKQIVPKYLYYLLLSDNVHKRAVSMMEGTTGRQRIPKTVLKKRIIVSLPSSLDEQISIVKQLDKISILCRVKQSKIEILNLLKISLLQNLITGKIRLSELQIAELADKISIVSGE